MNKRQGIGYTIAAALLLGVLFAQAMTAIPRLAITFDEDLHLSTGYGTLRTGDLRLVEDHPPLIGHWMSWPLLLSPDVPAPEDVPAWEHGDRRLFVRNDLWWRIPIDRWSLPPRIPIAWLTLLLGAFLFRWAADWFGPRAGLFALALYVFDPNILAHGTLATLDLGVTCFIFVALFGLWRFLHRSSLQRLLTAGVFTGLALGAKVSGFLVLPVGIGLIGLWELRRWWAERELRRSAVRLIGTLTVFLGALFLTLWAVHLFDWGPPPGLSVSLPMPTYWNSFLRVGRHVSRGNPAFLMGKTYVGGRWTYFPIVFLLKTPLPTLLLAGAALFNALRSCCRRPHRCWQELVLAIFPAGYFLMSMMNQINLGYRHILPLLPFVYLSVARLAAPPRRGDPRGRPGQGLAGQGLALPLRGYVVILCILIFWQAVGTLRVWPFHLTYFNEIAGGPRNGYRYLADSNVDWGQATKALRDYLAERDWPTVSFSSFTFFIRPELYGVQATPLPPLADAPPVLPSRFNPAPGDYVISASTLRGLQLIDREMYNWFWHREPDDVIANALLVYHVPEPELRPAWLAQCSAPAAPLAPEDVETGLGRDVDGLRLAYFDCTRSWLYPDGGATAGWYALHRETATSGDSFVARQSSRARISFEQRTPHDTPPLTVFEWSPAPPAPVSAEMVWTAPVEWPPQQALDAGTPLTPPVHLDGPLTFLGYETLSENDQITLLTWWQVEELDEPLARPFSLMGHLLDTHGRPVAVGDGLGVALDQLHAGDILVQRHDLTPPPDAPPGQHWLQTGAYWLDTLERWPIRIAGAAAGDRLLLALPPTP